MVGKWHPWESGRWHPQRPIDSCGNDDFNIFIANILREYPGYVTEMYGWYTEGVDFIGKNESLEDDLIKALEKAGLQIDADTVCRFPKVNQSNTFNHEPEWDPELLKKVIETESAGIDRFGYRDQVEKFASTKGVSLS